MDVIQRGADVLKELQARGWTVRRSTSPEPLLPPEVSRRYPRIPVELIGFLETIDTCVNAEENIWFLCREDFRQTGEQGFRWNEFELMRLEDGDGETQEQVRGFWDRHFPFMLAVHSDYDYLAVNLDERSYGQVVHGFGPGFDETSPVAASFAEFLTLFRDAAAGRRDEYPLSVFV